MPDALAARVIAPSGAARDQMADVIGETARGVAADLAMWAERWPIFDPVRIPAVARTVSVQLRDESRPARAVAGLVALWIIAFDAVVDERRRSDGDIAHLVAHCAALGARNDLGSLECAEPLCAAWAEIVRNVSRCVTYPGLARLWSGAAAQMIRAIVQHRELASQPFGSPASASRAMPVPSFARVLALTSRSIGVRFYLITTWILTEDLAVGARLPALKRAADAIARAIRLANDLQTWQRDEREGSVNTIWALERRLASGSLPADQRREEALRAARRRLRSAAASAHAALARSPLPEAPIERGMARLVDFVVELYGRADYATYRGA